MAKYSGDNRIFSIQYDIFDLYIGKIEAFYAKKEQIESFR